MELMPQQAWRWERGERYGFVLNLSGSVPGRMFVATLGYSSGIASAGQSPEQAVDRLCAEQGID